MPERVGALVPMFHTGPVEHCPDSLVHAVAVNNPRARHAAETAAIASDVLDVPVTAHQSIPAALEAATALGNAVLVTGSIYLVGEVRAILAVE